MTPHRKAQRLLKKYLEGKCTPSEVALLHGWYESLPEVPAAVPDEAGLEAKLSAAIWSGIRQTETPVRRMPVRWLAAACIISVVTGAGALWWWSARKIEISNQTATAKVLTLPDGTKVWLNAHSTLRWRPGFATDRAVTLDGEGYFKVAPDAAHPFRVLSRDIIAKVLGTEFNMESYAGEDQERVALVSGSVQVSSIDGRFAPTILRPGQIASLATEKQAIDVQPGDATAYASWVSGGFTLQSVPLELALKRLCHKYGYTLKAGFLRGRQKPITVTFKNEGFEEILASILYINHLTYSIQDSVVSVR